MSARLVELDAAAARRPAGPRAAQHPRLMVPVLVAVAVAWGLSFVVIKDALTTTSASDLVGWRFAIAALVLLLLRPRCLLVPDRRVVGSGLALGVLLGLGFWLCAVGMRTTSVVASAFIIGTTVVLTPVVARVWFRRRLTRRTLLATVLATLGLALLTLRGIDVGGGAVLILLAAGLFAVHLCGLSRWVSADRIASSTLVQLVTAAVLVLAIGVLTDGAVHLPRPHELGSVLYLGAIATAAAFLALTWVQTRIDATTTAIVLTLEPVVGAAAAVLLGEPLSAAVVAGALAVLAATGLATNGARRRPIPVRSTAIPQDGPGVGSRSSARLGSPHRRAA